MPPKIEMWTKEKENMLVYLVEKCPILWDVSCKDYKRVDLKYGKWHEIAEILGPSFDADAVQHRFANMKHTFMTNYRKERDSRSRCSEKGTEEIYKPKWFLYDKLKFLKKTSAQATSVSNLQSPSNVPFSDETRCSQDILQDSSQDASQDIYEDIEYLESAIVDIPQPHFYNKQLWQPISVDNETQHRSSSDKNISCDIGNVQPNSSSSCNTSLPSSQPTVPSVTSSSTSKASVDEKENLYVKRGAKKKKESIIQEAVLAMKKISNEPAPVPFQNDSVEHFGNFVAAKLREMEPFDLNSVRKKL